jgi:uncharacterized repeat protein (TIGR01451 family)
VSKRVLLAGICLAGSVLLSAALIAAIGRAAPARAHPSAPARTVVINEVAWMGSAASPRHEWIELANMSAETVSLAGWQIAFLDGTPSTITLSGEIAPFGLFLLERAEEAVADIHADLVYGPADLMADTGEGMALFGGDGTLVDAVNLEGGPWPAGQAGTPARTMERVDPTAPGDDDNWCTNDMLTQNGQDANGNSIHGTPRARNSCYSERRPDLSVVKRGPETARAGATLEYHIEVSNTGRLTASAALLTDTLPPVLTFVEQTSPFTCLQSGPSVVWLLGDVPPETSFRITLAARLTHTATGSVANLLTATAATSEAQLANNSAQWLTQIVPPPPLRLPVVLRAYRPPLYDVLIEAVLYDGVQYNDADEAVMILNGDDEALALAGWQLCKWGASGWNCAPLPAAVLGRGGRLWLARHRESFAASFGFAPDYVLSGWPGFTNEGDEVVLRDPAGNLRDTLVYGLGSTSVGGWQGAAVQPYLGTSFAREGQVLYRWADERTGLPPDDADTAADWAQFAGEPWCGQRVRYPGWDLERFYQPAIAATGRVTVGIAPDNADQVVVDAIRSADEHIELELYTLTHAGLVAELVARAQAGVSVTVLLEGGPVGGLSDQERWACQQLHATGHGLCYAMVNSSTLHIHDRYPYLHSKMMLVDGEVLVVGSQNFTYSDLPGDNKANGTGGSRGVVLATDAPAIVARAAEIFAADCDPAAHADISRWGPGNPFGFGPPPPGFTPSSGADWLSYTVQFPQPVVATGSELTLLSAPESALRSSDALLGLVARAGAGDAVYVEQMIEPPHWGNPDSAPNLRLESYLAAARRGARVRILLNGGDFATPGFSLADNVATIGRVVAIAQAEGLDLQARLGDPTDYGVHNKMVLVDLGARGQYAHVGSINGTETSNKANREIALQVRSAGVFALLRQMFEYDWTHPPPGHLVISEVLYRPLEQSTGNREWIELYNPTDQTIALGGWYLGDMVAPVGALPNEWGEGMYRFPAGAVLPPGGVIVIVQQAADVSGFTPDYEFLTDRNRDVPGVPNMVRADPGTGDGLRLVDTGDEVVLRDAAGVLVDAATYGTGAMGGVVAHPGVVNAGHSLERRPPEWDTDDCSRDFYDRYPPTPRTVSP